MLAEIGHQCVDAGVIYEKTYMNVKLSNWYNPLPPMTPTTTEKDGYKHKFYHHEDEAV